MRVYPVRGLGRVLGFNYQLHHLCEVKFPISVLLHWNAILIMFATLDQSNIPFGKYFKFSKI